MSDTSPANTPLVERKLFAGPRIRRLRRELGLTQAAMASALGISTSYLNLLERDQRPVSAQILLRLVDVFDIDPRGLAGDEEARAQAQLHEVFADPMFRDTPLSVAELKDLAAASPVGVDAVARLYQAYQESRTTTSMLAACFAMQAAPYFEYVESDSNWVDEISRKGLDGSWAPLHNFALGVCTFVPNV